MNNLITGLISSTDEISIGLILLIYLFVILVMIGVYIYSSLALMAIANKTKTEPAWLAWIPIGNLILLSRIAKMHWWPILLIIPANLCVFAVSILALFEMQVLMLIFSSLYVILMLTFVVFCVIWNWKMFEAVNRPGWWGVIPFITTPLLLMSIFTLNGWEFLFRAIELMILSSLCIILYLILLGISAWSDGPKSQIKIILR